MKYATILAGSLLAFGVAAPAMAEPASDMLLAQYDAVMGDNRVTVVKIQEASMLPGYAVVVARSYNEPYETFYVDSADALEVGQRLYVIDDAIYTDAEGTDRVALSYAVAVEEFIALQEEEMNATIFEMRSSTEVVVEEEVMVEEEVEVQPAPAPEPAPEPVRALW